MKMKTLIALLLLTSNAFALVHAPDQYKKITDSRGRGPIEVSGIVNLREVIPGVLYRSGKSIGNKFGPLSDTSLVKLCNEGYSTAFYDYRRGQDHNVPCGTNQVSLKIRPSLAGEKYVRDQLSTIYTAIKQGLGPVISSCDAGHHASGYVSAAALIQFCGYTNQQALAYWIKNTDGDSNYPSVKAKVLAFRPYNDLLISAKCFKP
jgi:hypothetical protein